jgi:uncharacterized membrane protein YuzA (DUF378 family)
VFSFFVGLFYVFLGVAGFWPALLWVPMNPIQIRDTDSAWDVQQLFGNLPVTTASNILHLLVGAAGIFAAVSFAASRSYSRGLAAFMLLLVFTGVMPFGVNTLWGALPLSGGVLAIHIITAPIAFYFGYVYLFDARAAHVPGVA